MGLRDSGGHWALQPGVTRSEPILKGLSGREDSPGNNEETLSQGSNEKQKGREVEGGRVCAPPLRLGRVGEMGGAEKRPRAGSPVVHGALGEGRGWASNSAGKDATAGLQSWSCPEKLNKDLLSVPSTGGRELLGLRAFISGALAFSLAGASAAKRVTISISWQRSKEMSSRHLNKDPTLTKMIAPSSRPLPCCTRRALGCRWPRPSSTRVPKKELCFTGPYRSGGKSTATLAGRTHRLPWAPVKALPAAAGCQKSHHPGQGTVGVPLLFSPHPFPSLGLDSGAKCSGFLEGCSV